MIKLTKNIYPRAVIISIIINLLLVILISTLISLPAQQTEESYLELSLLDTIPPVMTQEEQAAAKESSSKSSFWSKIMPDSTPPASSENAAAGKSSAITAKDIQDTGSSAAETIPTGSGALSSSGTASSSTATAGNAGTGIPSGSDSSSGSKGTANATAAAEIIPPSVISRVEPEYNDEMRANGWSGEVTVSVYISAAGNPEKVSVASSSGYKVLDRAAVAAVKQWRFAPAHDSKTGATLASHTTVVIAFNLQ